MAAARDLRVLSRLAGAVLMFIWCSVSLAAQTPSRASNQPSGRGLFNEHCAVCHHENSGTRAPLPSVLRQMSSQEIVQTLQTGVMKAQGSELTPGEREAIADFLGRRQRVVSRITTGFCSQRLSPLVTGDAVWNGWGNSPANARFQPTSRAGLDRDQVKRLKLKWAFGFPGSSRVQPTVFGGRVLVGGSDGSVYSLNARTGCIEWIFKAASGIKAAVSVSANGRQVYIGDGSANVYAVSMASRTLVWKRHVDEHPLATITGAPLLLKGRLYVPVSSGEEGAAVNPYYACCTFRGSVVALDAPTGKIIWKVYTIPDVPKLTGKNAVGVATWGPSGAAVWSAPTADLLHRAIYVGTGNNYSNPATSHSDAVLAFDMNTGRLLWSRQVTPDDRWNVACLKPDKTN